jgi:aldose 1-epimerase
MAAQRWIRRDRGDSVEVGLTRSLRLTVSLDPRAVHRRHQCRAALRTLVSHRLHEKPEQEKGEGENDIRDRECSVTVRFRSGGQKLRQVRWLYTLAMPIPLQYSAVAVSLAIGFHMTVNAGTAQSPPRQAAGVTRAAFGKMTDGSPVEMFTLRNANAVEVRAINYGAIITSIRVPDRQGRFADVVLGFDTVDPYLKTHPYFGAVVGRYGNRIAKGQFTIDGQTYKLATNNGANHLHGGIRGFDKSLWSASPMAGAVGVVFTRTSPDGEEGYPGTLAVRIAYSLGDRNDLTVEYQATTDKPTPVNLTQHSYFNLAGGGDILGHELMLNADRFTPVDSTLIPTGELASVEGTPFDFRKPTPIGARIGAANEQLKNGGGYDHNWVLNRKDGALQLAARLVDPASGRMLEIATTEPGLQFYSGNFLDGTITGKGGQVYKHRTGLALETQHFPDSPNKPNFPTTILRPDRKYSSRTVYTFGIQP